MERGEEFEWKGRCLRRIQKDVLQVDGEVGDGLVGGEVKGKGGVAAARELRVISSRAIMHRSGGKGRSTYAPVG